MARSGANRQLWEIAERTVDLPARSTALVLLSALPLALPPLARPGAAQSRAAVEQERREFAAWLNSAPLSPRRAIGLFPIGKGLALGAPPADIVMRGAAARVEERGSRVLLIQSESTLPLVRGRAASLGKWQLLVGGTPGRAVLTVFEAGRLAGKAPVWFGYDSALAFPVTLEPPATPATLRLLAPDGLEVEAAEAGSVHLSLGGRSHRLQVRRLPGESDEEAELEIYFRDVSNGYTTYPAGRFVTLLPLPGGGRRYVLDFNRARNPYCAYNTAYPCPAPWRGNALPVAVEAGERYQGGGLTPPPED